MAVAAIGYLRMEASDVPAWMTFGTDVLGLMDAGRDDDAGAAFLRMDDHPFRWMLEPGDGDRLLATGIEYRSDSDWAAVCDALATAGHSVTTGSAEDAARRCVTAFATVDDPSGNTLELYHGRLLDYAPLVSPTGVQRFVTGDAASGDLGFGHAVLPAPEEQATVDFYTDLIGFAISDRLHLPMPDARVIFMHADNPRQHSLALFNGPHPAGVVHIMAEVSNLDEVGRAYDRAQKGGYFISATLGRHVNDNMCSFYVLAPGGIAVEYGYDGLLVDWNKHAPTESSVGDVWGHEYNFPGVNDQDG